MIKAPTNIFLINNTLEHIENLYSTYFVAFFKDCLPLLKTSKDICLPVRIYSILILRRFSLLVYFLSLFATLVNVYKYSQQLRTQVCYSDNHGTTSEAIKKILY